MTHTLRAGIRRGRGLALPVAVAGLVGAVALHGLDLRVTRDGDHHVVTATYTAGAPAAGAEVTVHAPVAAASPGGNSAGAAADAPAGADAPAVGGADEVWQVGLTDPHGRFVFTPDRPGEWRVTVDDGQGHRAVLVVAVGSQARVSGQVVEVTPEHRHDEGGEPEDSASGPAAPTAGDTRFWRLVAGVSLIAALTGVAYGAAARR